MSSPSPNSPSISPDNRKEPKTAGPDLGLLRQMPECVCLGLRRAARQITRHYDRGLGKLGLASQQVTILAVVELNRSLSIGDLAAFLGMDRTTLTRNLRPLFVQRLVQRLASKDRRKKMINLTVIGRERLAQALPHWHVAQREALEAIGTQQWQKIRALLESAAASLEQRTTKSSAARGSS